MSYWNKSLKRDLLTNRTNTLLADLTSEIEKLDIGHTKFGNLAYQSISNSPSISVIKNIALKYRAVICGFKTAAEYDAIDCRTLLGYIAEEPEDLIFGELYGNWEVAKQNRDNEEAAKIAYINANSGSKTVWEWIVDTWMEVTYHINPDELVVKGYDRRIQNYQKEMDAWQAKLDHLGEFDDRSGALFANSVDFRTNAIKAMNDLKDCVSPDGTFKDISYSYGLNQLDKLHELKQDEYLKKWLDKDGNIDMDAVEEFLFQDPDSVPMDQYLAFCKLMDQMSDEQMTEVMNMSTKEIPNASGSYIEVSKIFQNAADMNAVMWCTKYKINGYSPEGFDEEAMERAIAIKYATDKVFEWATTKFWTTEIDSENVYVVLPVYVSGSKVYILPYISRTDAINADYYYNLTTDPENGVNMVFRCIIDGCTDDYVFTFQEWTIIDVSNDSLTLDDLCKDLDYWINQIGGTDWDPAEKIGNEVALYAADFLLDKASLGIVSDVRDWLTFVVELEKEYKSVLANQNAHEEVKSIKIFNAFYIFRGTSIITQGGNPDPIEFENLRFDTGRLQVAIAAYNEYNEGVDIDINWVYDFKNCPEEKKVELGKYLDWFYRGQLENSSNGAISDYADEFYYAYEEIQNNPPGITKAPNMYNLTPAQFKEVQNYMKDPNYTVNYSLWE